MVVAMAVAIVVGIDNVVVDRVMVVVGVVLAVGWTRMGKWRATQQDAEGKRGLGRGGANNKLRKRAKKVGRTERGILRILF